MVITRLKNNLGLIDCCQSATSTLFYKSYSDQLVPILHTAFNHALNNPHLIPSRFKFGITFVAKSYLAYSESYADSYTIRDVDRSGGSLSGSTLLLWSVGP
ncbi:hypothetical protein DFA_03749 [Cavenderia fasciculata]|uniref:Uncharacterized protein n=1 Tax=Cavenderia fasciculata TaxID=261658 RepID=F4Q0A7_CACFS|nr:uncharacterized protein DFA_03749 [Cavenderia fasciculata]EGG18258.1 hypothetical protein DFA_03749 [Cavenderia fasciculata]|eukprot:XP_004357081.1 hypothetical protein DFA_03749 [Cavenderia fasciculata]